MLLRERYAVMNLNHARAFTDKGPSGGKVAIIDASNVSLKRRQMLLGALPGGQGALHRVP
jgi:hypothetical protein